MLFAVDDAGLIDEGMVNRGGRRLPFEVLDKKRTNLSGPRASTTFKRSEAFLIDTFLLGYAIGASPMSGNDKVCQEAKASGPRGHGYKLCNMGPLTG